MYKKLKCKKSLLFLFITMFMLMFSSRAFAEVSKERVYGKDRIGTSIEISKSGWKEGSKYAVIVQGYDFADALSAAPLAKKYNAPIILSNNLKLDNSTLEELKRLESEKVFILGGPKVISTQVEAQLKEINVKSIERIYGATRYETSLKVAEKLGQVNTVFITNGVKYADALSVSSIAAQKGIPILYSEKENMIPAVKQYITKNKVSNVYFIGGNGVISDKALNEVTKSERLYGKDRYETNKVILEKFIKELNFDNLYFVRGDDYADALSIAPLAATQSSPVILTNKNISKDIEEILKSEITSRTKLILVGGEEIVPSKVVDNLNMSFEIVEIAKANEVFGEKTSTKNIDGDILVKADNVTLKNINLNGVLILDPGKNGTVNVEDCNFKQILVKSGDVNSIKLNSVKSNKLIVDSNNDLSVKLYKNTLIENTEVRTSSKLEAVNGSFGKLKIVGNNKDKNIELIGSFNEDVIVNSQANIKSNNKINKIEINPFNLNSKVIIKGSANTTNIINGVNTILDGEFSKVKITNSSKVRVTSKSRIDEIDISENSEVNIDKGAIVNKLYKTNDTKFTGEVKSIVEKKDGQSQQKEDEKNTFSLVVSNNGSEIIDKKIKIEKGKSAMEYLKENASVEDKSGFINGINGISSVPLSSLSESKRKNDILGIDWFIYLNGDKTRMGANGVYPKEGDVLKFLYREWDWKDLMDPDHTGPMPLRVIGLPGSVQVNEKFEIEVTCVNRPIYGATVKVDGKEVAITDIDGIAVVSISTPGNHKVTVEKEGGKEEKTIRVVEDKNSGGTNNGNGNTGGEKPNDGKKETILLEQTNGNFILTIKKTENNNVSIDINNKNNIGAEILTIKLYDEKGKLAYIDQVNLKEGKCKFNTLIESGEYTGAYKVNGQMVNMKFSFK